MKGLLTWLSRLVFIFVVAIAIAIGSLARYPTLRSRWFSNLCKFLTDGKDEELKIRCNLLRNIGGDILELGPGPATNAECFLHNDRIKSYTGIEPNTFMHAIFHNKTTSLGLSFPIKLLTIQGESLDLPDESFDDVVITHVLCSCHNVSEVLSEVTRVLKPGGKIYYMEHIASPLHTWMRWFQLTIEPVWSILTDGCKFIDSWKDLDSLREGGDYEYVEYSFFDAPMPLAIVKPHLQGIAVKKRKES